MKTTITWHDGKTRPPRKGYYLIRVSKRDEQTPNKTWIGLWDGGDWWEPYFAGEVITERIELWAHLPALRKP